VLEGLLAAGFAGALCSEWGGHEWHGPDMAAAPQVDAHRRLVRDRFGADRVDFGTKTT
jgi:hypothetical protein